ncbi:hypothetical protein ABN028_05400 [Actinopolymorpha sp. B17G11]|uniref:hypothetical protein n=1 Tax=Actinopolymorpha sp. B17G11 TaxID=3160861 RepID=UPI0032E5006D
MGSATRTLSPAPIGLVLDDGAAQAAHHEGRDAWWLYTTEVLDHVRLPYDVLAPDALTGLGAATADAPGVLVFPHPPSLDAAAVTAVTGWVERGGALVLCGGSGTLVELTGVTAGSPVADGHVEIVKGALTQPPDVPLHAYGGVELAPGDGGDVLARWTSGVAAIAARSVGRGVVVVCGVDLWQSIVRIQQGFRVEQDGAPAADGSCPVDDGILKCDDGLPLSYERDRALPPGEAGVAEGLFPHEYPPPAAAPIFHRPQADIWRRVFLTLVLDAAERCGVVLPWLFYWPAGVPAVAHMSHDSDGNVSEYAATALEVFDEVDVRVTWCHVYPGGYDPAIVQAIADRGHEQALHYNAMEDADIASWGWPQLRAQYAWAQALTGRERIVCNKNHYTRWEGWHEFFVWCERIGIEIDQSRGPSKQGDVGFPFGSCHLWFPMADAAEANRRIDVLELPLHTQDLAWAGHEANRDVILDQVLAEHGVAHFLFHSPHLHLRPPTRAACVRLAAEARSRGMVWWTSEQLNSWERRRRGVRLDVTGDADGALRVAVETDEALDGAAVLLAVPGLAGDAAFTVEAGAGTATVVVRHGRPFVELATDLPTGSTSFLLRQVRGVG